MKIVACGLAAALALAALGGCNSTNTVTARPQIAGSYTGALIVYTSSDITQGDTLLATVALAQSGATLTGTWSAVGTRDTLSGDFGVSTVGTQGSNGAAAVTLALRVKGPSGCSGTLAIPSATVTPMLGASTWVIEGRWTGAASCLRSNVALNGDFLVIGGKLAAPALPGAFVVAP